MEPAIKTAIESALKERVIELLRKKDFLSILINKGVFESERPEDSDLDYNAMQINLQYYDFESQVYKIYFFEWILPKRLLNRPHSFPPYSQQDIRNNIVGTITKPEVKLTYDSINGTPIIEILKLDLPPDPIYKIQWLR